MVLRSLIVDDEHLCRDWLKELLEPCEDVNIVGEAASVGTAVTEIERLQPDLIFLDIKLPDGTAFDVLEQTIVRGHVVFLTAYSQHAVRAFEVDALDYLVKPAEPERVEQALTRARARPLPARSLEAGRLAVHDRVLLRRSNRARSCLVSEIAFIAGANEYSEVHLTSGYVALLRRPLRFWERRLPATFVRIHRSTIANLDLMESLTESDGGLSVRLQSVDGPLPVSRRRAHTVRERLEVLNLKREQG